MATGGDVSRPLSKGSEEMFDFCCTPCSKKGSIVEADHHCLDCDQYFCGQCVDFHNIIGGTSGHRMFCKERMVGLPPVGSNPEKPLPRCQVHGESMKVICGEHDVICCDTCVSISHSTCRGKTKISEAARGVKSSKQLKTAKYMIASWIKEIKKVRIPRQNDLKTLDREKMASVREVDDFIGGLIKRMKDLEKITLDHIHVKHKELSDNAMADVAAMDDMISVLEEDAQKLDKSQEKSDSQVFIDIKLGHGHEAGSRRLLQRLGKPRRENLKIVMNTDIEEFLDRIRSLGEFADDMKV